MSRHGLACLGSQLEFGVATKPGHGGGSWCCDMGVVSRQGQVVSGVATRVRLASSVPGHSTQRATTVCNVHATQSQCTGQHA